MKKITPSPLKIFGFITSLLFGMSFLSLAYADSESENPLQIEAQLIPASVDPQQIVELRLKLRLPEGYKAYEDQFKLKVTHGRSTGESVKVASFKVTPTKAFFDKFSKRERTGVTGESILTAPVEMPEKLNLSEDELKIELTYQACTETYCLFPQVKEARAHFTVKNLASQTDKSFFDWNFEHAFSQGLFWTFVFVFIFGILTSFTPCIFPMIPITLAVLGREAHTRSKWQNAAVAHLYVFGIALTYALLGVFAASTGALFGSFMSHPLVLGFMCFIFFAMALSMFGLFDLNPPQFIQNYLAHRKSSGYLGVFITGVLAGVVASPCVGPVLVAILTYVAKTQNVTLGFWLLFVYALGLGQLFILLGLFSSLTKKLPRSGPWMEGIKHFFGVLMMGGFFYFFDLLVDDRIFDFALGATLVTLGSLFGAFRILPVDSRPFQLIRRGWMLALVILGSAYIVSAAFDLRTKLNSTSLPVAEKKSVNAQVLNEESYQLALQSGKPLVIDFWAEWCAACYELENKTFPDPRVQERMKSFTFLKFDATKGSPELDTYKKKYGIVGLPTLIFYDSQGKQILQETLTEFEPPEKFLERLSRVQSQSF
ncbi:MAG: protein-disulfide reductase DsbD [Pseudobdellovibrionaceae bacterium]